MKKKQPIHRLITHVQNSFGASSFEINGKKVSEYRFFKSIADDIKGKKKKDLFYWTDKKVLLLLECLDIKISKETLSEFKSHCR